MSIDVNNTATLALAEMSKAGFDQAQVSVSISEQDELNINHNEPSLLRSTEDYAISLTGIVDGRKAVMALTDISPHAIESGIGELIERARIAPQDEANAVSDNQVGQFEQGPLAADLDLLALKVEELLQFRASETPKMQLEEGAASHRISREAVMTSGGSKLGCTVGAYSLSVMGTAIDGDASSSFNYTGGTANDLSQAHASELFAIGEMMRDTEQQIHTRSIPAKFVGDVILAPTAVRDLLGWLLGQLQDFSLIAGHSLYKDRVGEQIASDKLTIRSHFDAPGHAPYTGDAFLAPALTLLDAGKLTCLVPSYYASRKTDLPHTPASSGWQIEPGGRARAAMISDIKQGALVNRLSMGSPAANGDFSGVIKNSFYIEGGRLSGALSETMIAGNMANMLGDIVAVSMEHLDLGGTDFPWISVGGLNFS